MGSRAVAAAIVAGAIVLVALVASTRSGPPVREPTTWIVEDGTTRAFRASELRPDDDFKCSDGGGGVEGVPSPGYGVGGSSGITVMTELDGTVTVKCDPGPPGNV